MASLVTNYAHEAARWIISHPIITAFVAVMATPTFQLVYLIVQPRISALNILPGPPGEWHAELFKQYGHVFRFRGLFGRITLVTSDPVAIHRILNETAVYQKSPFVKYILGSVLGNGLLFAEGAEHKRQRRIMNPSFSGGHIKQMIGIFFSKSLELRDILSAAIDASESRQEAQLDMLDYTSRTALDIIGLAGFDYAFNSLSDETNELALAVKQVAESPGGIPIFPMLKARFPILRPFLNFDATSKRLNNASRRLQEVGKTLISEKKKHILAESPEKGQPAAPGASKDLLSLMIRSNLEDGEGKGLTDDEILNQIPTFLLAGHETTSTSIVWTLCSLAIDPEIQDRLRQEILAVPTDTPSVEQLNSLSYLDAVIRESLRYYAVANAPIRVAKEDDIIPVSKPYTDRYGVERNTIQVSKGDAIVVPISVINNSEEIWGSDAKTFNPDRWSSPPEASNAYPGIWGNQLTFLGGPHSCIGFKFAIMEMKVVLFTLLRNFVFELAVPKEEIVRRPGIVTRPSIKSRLDEGNQLPMIIKHVNS